MKHSTSFGSDSLSVRCLRFGPVREKVEGSEDDLKDKNNGLLFSAAG